MTARLVLEVTALILVGSLAACTVTVPPGKTAYPTVTNGCLGPIVAAVARDSDSIAADCDPSTLPVIGPGEQVQLVAPLSLPIGDGLKLWVVQPGVARIGEPTILAVADLDRTETDQGVPLLFHITVSGDLCP